MAIIFMLSTPLIVLDTHRVYKSINAQISQGDATKLAQLQEIESKIDQVSNVNQIISLGNALGIEPRPLQNTPITTARETIKKRLTALKTTIETKVQITRKTQAKKLLKSSARSLYSGIFITFAFIFIWFKLGTLGDRHSIWCRLSSIGLGLSCQTESSIKTGLKLQGGDRRSRCQHGFGIYPLIKFLGA